MTDRSHRLLACVVTYSPDAAVPERLRAIAAQVDHVLVVDNTPARAELAVDDARISVVFNENRGAIAGASITGPGGTKSTAVTPNTFSGLFFQIS